ncbi:hypothetical protein HD553DRAFT_358927, partial [Filobasidium floriforme]|uniref:uncharacterized protein n=1 Tax=Filobasidium floriforme TaxID=5210 RepID=UPI001E8DE7A2
MPRRYPADKGMKETRAWNVPHYKRLHNCLLTSLGEEYLAQTSYLEFDAADEVVKDEKLRSLAVCEKEELNVVIGGTFHFGARHFGRVSGEDIWARSTIDSYQSLGYTFLYAFEIIESMEINLEIPSLVHMVMAEAGHIKDCSSPDYEPHENWRCVKSEGFEEGLPIWKMFSWHFWESPAHPLGHQFTLAPEDYARYPSRQGKENNLYIGYSIESYCANVQPEADRERRAYILAKHASYFEPPAYKYSTDVFERIKGSSGIDFIAGSGKQGDQLPDEGIENMGMMPSERFVQELGRSQALIGIGKPIISPTPYDALCMGVPFINPVMQWSTENPEDRSLWTWQHEGLANVEAPYVYTV